MVSAGETVMRRQRPRSPCSEWVNQQSGHGSLPSSDRLACNWSSRSNCWWTPNLAALRSNRPAGPSSRILAQIFRITRACNLVET